jgi:hypothetical protein
MNGGIEEIDRYNYSSASSVFGAYLLYREQGFSPYSRFLKQTTSITFPELDK